MVSGAPTPTGEAHDCFMINSANAEKEGTLLYYLPYTIFKQYCKGCCNVICVGPKVTSCT